MRLKLGSRSLLTELLHHSILVLCLISGKNRNNTVALIAITLRMQPYVRPVTFFVTRMFSLLIKEIFKLNRNTLNK